MQIIIFSLCCQHGTIRPDSHTCIRCVAIELVVLKSPVFPGYTCLSRRESVGWGWLHWKKLHSGGLKVILHELSQEHVPWRHFMHDSIWMTSRQPCTNWVQNKNEFTHFKYFQSALLLLLLVLLPNMMQTYMKMLRCRISMDAAQLYMCLECSIDPCIIWQPNILKAVTIKRSYKSTLPFRKGNKLNINIHRYKHRLGRTHPWMWNAASLAWMLHGMSFCI